MNRQQSQQKPGGSFERAKSNQEIQQAIFGRVPPNAVDLEAAILGAMLLENSKVDDVLDIIPDENCFYNEAHKLVFKAIQAIFSAGGNVDMLTVTNELDRLNLLVNVGGAQFIASLTLKVLSTAHVEAHARIVMEKFIAREVIRQCSELIGSAYDGRDAFELVEEIGEFAISMTDNLVKRNYEHVSVPMEEMLAEVLEMSQVPEGVSGVPAGFKDLDKVSGGFSNTDLIILAARPSVGKTAFALNIALGAIANDQKQTTVGIFSLEMSSKQLLQRITSNVSGIEFRAIRTGKMQPDELERVFDSGAMIKKMPLYIDDTAGLTIIQLRSKARKMKIKHGVGLIIIDYLQLMHGGPGSKGNREQEISQISRGLKGLAKELNIPIIALSQLSRAVESRSDNQPKLSDLRESGAIEQDADSVYFLYANSKEELKSNPYKFKERHLKLAKHRNGSLADFVFDFNGAYQRFEKCELAVMDIEYENNGFKMLGSNQGFGAIGNAGVSSEEGEGFPF